MYRVNLNDIDQLLFTEESHIQDFSVTAIDNAFNVKEVYKLYSIVTYLGDPKKEVFNIKYKLTDQLGNIIEYFDSENITYDKIIMCIMNRHNIDYDKVNKDGIKDILSKRR